MFSWLQSVTGWYTKAPDAPKVKPLERSRDDQVDVTEPWVASGVTVIVAEQSRALANLTGLLTPPLHVISPMHDIVQVEEIILKRKALLESGDCETGTLLVEDAKWWAETDLAYMAAECQDAQLHAVFHYRDAKDVCTPILNKADRWLFAKKARGAKSILTRALQNYVDPPLEAIMKQLANVKGPRELLQMKVEDDHDHLVLTTILLKDIIKEKRIEQMSLEKRETF